MKVLVPVKRVVERFRVDSVVVADRAYQGHVQQTLYGAYEETQVDLPAGTRIVPLDQPLGRLAFHLLEPRAADGLANWGLVDLGGREIVPERPVFYPILRLPAVAGPADL